MTLDTLNFLLTRKYYLRLGAQTGQTITTYVKFAFYSICFATYFKLALLTSRSSLL